MAPESWVALSSRYYMDDKLAGCSAGVERMFTRILAYCRLAGTGGRVPGNAHILVGLPRRRSDVIDLVRRQILVPINDETRTEPGTQTRRIHVPEHVPTSVPNRVPEDVSFQWQFAAWSDWQEKGDALQQRRQVDRERKRRQRANVTGQSRDVSRENLPTQNRTEQISNGSSSATGSSAREREEPPTGPAVRPDAWKHVRDIIPSGHPQPVKTELALQAGTMLVSGTPETDVRAALELWLTKPNLGPKVLPSLVSEVIKSRDRPRTNGHAFASPADERVAQAQALRSTPITTHPLELQ